MLSPFICGNFNHQDAEEDRECLTSNNSPCSTPRKSRKSNSNKYSKNPYSTRGLDKFSALLSELEQKRQKIYSQVGSQDISLVRFKYSSSNEAVPVLVKLENLNKHRNKASGDKYENDDKPKTNTKNAEPWNKLPIDASAAVNQRVSKQSRLEVDKTTGEKKKAGWNLTLYKWRRPSYYIPVFIVSILVFLTFFGRSAAILWTSIGWYIVPTLNSKQSSSEPAKKKQLVRRFSEISPASRKVDGAKVKSPPGRQSSF